MTRVLSALAVIGLVACTNDAPGQFVLKGELEVSPALTDIGTRPVGVASEFTVSLTALVADIRITDVSVLNADEEYFAVDEWWLVYRGEGANRVRDEEGSTPLIIDKDTTIHIPAYFAPLQEGYFRAQLQFSGNFIVDGDIQAEVRGRADTPSAACYPRTLDFGAADVGDPAIPGFIAVVNESDLPLEISDVTATDEAMLGQFIVDQATTFTVPPGETADVQLGFLAARDAPASGRARVFVGDQPICNITLRANNCENGVPSAYDVDQDGFTVCGGDCDDDDPAVHPGAIEVANTLDDDCDGTVDNGTSIYDDDGDGYCDDPGQCAGSWLPGDCNDGDFDVNPGVEEIMGDGIDNDCDGQVDGGTLDFDFDGYTPAAGDCDPLDATVYPGAPELPDGKDNDCDVPTEVDEGTVLADDDGDGYCEGLPSGNTPCSDGAALGDCNDSDDTTHPNAVELPDWRDNDCDQPPLVDEGTDHFDDDGDGYTEDAGDCDDTDDEIGPASLEIPGDGIDNDCDPSTPDTAP